jgi:uncharacterized membrane protein YjfL (UPF0719 family)
MKLRTIFHGFIALLFSIGVLLAIVTFSAYSNLTPECTSTRLRKNLRMAIIVSGCLISISVGYTACAMASSCVCSFGSVSDYKLYSLLSIVVGLGIWMLVIREQIVEDLNTCGVKMDGAIDAMMGFGIAQIALPVLYVGIVFYMGGFHGVSGSMEEDSDELTLMKSLARESVLLEDSKAVLIRNLSDLKAQESSAKAVVATYESRGKKAPQNNRSKVSMISSQIKRKESAISEMSKQITDVSSKMDGGSVKSDKPFNVFGRM